MELSEIIAQDPEYLDDNGKDQIYEELSRHQNLDDVPKKSVRKTLSLCFIIMKHKGAQMIRLKERLENKTASESPDESTNGNVQRENDKLKGLVIKLESEKHSLKNKINEMNEEITHLQGQLTEALQNNESEKDSSDPLSELDRQEELLKNINTKNKHIKKLLREIEILQTNNIEQSKIIIDLEKHIQLAKIQISELNAKIILLEGEKKALTEDLGDLNAEVNRLEGNITYLEDEREKSEQDMSRLITKLESKAKNWRSATDQKDKELKKIKSKMDSLSGLLSLECKESNNTITDDDKDRLVEESTRMMHAIESRDKIIEKMEAKIKAMAEEMISSTRLMNQLSAEREEEKLLDSTGLRGCCKTIEESLQASNDRCRELSELLEKSEEDNILKAQQAAQALAALDAYHRGDDGLSKALKKIVCLEQKLASREQLIRTQVSELNAIHEISNENAILRKKLKIPEDMVISSRNFAAKERSKDKQIERLTMKLRASEEIRLQQKLEKSELRKELIELQKANQTLETSQDYNNWKSSQELRPSIYCDNCLKNLQSLPDKDAVMQDVIKSWENKYGDVVQENENLRLGMYEILEKIRDYDASSEYITIDRELLEKLLYALQYSSDKICQLPTQRIQKELLVLKEREIALRTKINEVGKMSEQSIESQESPDQTREAGEITNSPLPSPILNIFDSSTRPTTPNKTLDQSLYPVIVEADFEHEGLKTDYLKIQEKNRTLQQEIQKLLIFRSHYEDLRAQMAASENDITKYCSILVEKLSALEIKFNAQSKSYDFLKEDFDRSLSEHKASEMRNVILIADLKRQINDRKKEIDILQIEKNNLMKEKLLHENEDFGETRKNLFSLQTHLASLVELVFSGKAPDFRIEGLSVDYGIVQENLELDIITVDEYEQLQKELSEWKTTETALQIKCDHLENLLTISKDQVVALQKLLTEVTDNHINLRHLVADLQSTNEDKFLIVKIQRDLDYAKREVSSLKECKEKLEQNEEILRCQIKDKEREIDKVSRGFQIELKNTDIKNRFLQKALQNLRQKYFKYTPLIFLSNFVFAYKKYIKRFGDEHEKLRTNLTKHIEEILSSLTETPKNGDLVSQDRIKLIKTETKVRYLEDQVQELNQKNSTLQKELDDLRLSIATESEHWKTLEALFGDGQPKTTAEQEMQVESIETADSTTNTETEFEPNQIAKVSTVDSTTNTDVQKEATQNSIHKTVKTDKGSSPITSPAKQEQQKTKMNAETQTLPSATCNQQTSPIRISAKFEEDIEPDRSTARGVQTSPIKNRYQLVSTQDIQTSPISSPKKQSHEAREPHDLEIIDLKTQLKDLAVVAETRKHLLEKADSELQEYKKSIEDVKTELRELQSQLKNQKLADAEEKSSFQTGIVEKTILSFHSLLAEKDKAIHQYQELLTAERNHSETTFLKLEKEIQVMSRAINDLQESVKAKDEEVLELKSKMEASNGKNKEKLEKTPGVDDNGDNSLQEISDEKIEEMFNEESVSEIADRKPMERSKNIIEKELKNKEKFWENTIKIKEDEITQLKERLHLYQERDRIHAEETPEIEQLKALIDEKDKHINDLMDTLNNFHDDQQRFLDDSSNHSADQISKISASLSRSEAANKIYLAQLEALRRQLANVNHREKQARNLNNNLRNQLINRPVVSIKSELNARLKAENLQRKISQLETDLEEANGQIKRQQVIIDAKRAKSANEVVLWEKQKRWQQSAEKYKAKLEETEAALEKHKSLLHSARTTIARLEKDKQALEIKVGKGSFGLKCCRTPSCPNLQATKYTPSETPETYTGDSECSSPSRMHFLSNNNNDLIAALKARIEMQQRKIMAMEMEGRGNNTMITEFEKLQEKYSTIDAQNIRLEAQNLQLQLENDLLRQGDSGERMQKRIKHLEDYIIALKEELAQAEARKDLNCNHSVKKYAPGQAEQTILSLRSIVEKLKVENKYLKNDKKPCDSKSQDIPAELVRLQHMYSESLDKISALQIELQLKTRCQTCGKNSHSDPVPSDEIPLIKDQLLKKTQLLEKAKILLTRAAAKEKVLKEQLSFWKRKCSELQNVPVIDEISE